MLVFTLYSHYFVKPEVAPTPAPLSQASSASPAASAVPAEAHFTETAKSEDAPPPQSLPPLKTSVIENEWYRVESSNQSGVVKSLQLKKYHEALEKQSLPIDLFSTSPENNFVLEFEGRDFSLPQDIRYEVTREEKNLVEYQWKGSEVILTQRVEWDPENYMSRVNVRLENLTTRALSTSVGLGLETLQHREDHRSFAFLRGPANMKYPLLYQEGTVTRHADLKKLSPQVQEKGRYHWLGLEDRYFLWAVIARPVFSDNEVKYGFRESKEGPILYSKLAYPKDVIAPQAAMEKEFMVYVGPKELDRLQKLGVHLEEAVDYGWFGLVAHPILFLLKLFHQGLGNWGVAIIALTVFIKLLLHPINKKSLQSMKAMQKLQPKLKEIQEKYKDDKEKLNAEMMGLFKANKVNPVSGCLPMLLQMPVYFALYRVLYNSIELYQAPFFAFYKDLSAPDPYFISPVLLGIFMVLQQKLTPPTTQDPAQAKMMMLMPVMFSAFMLFLPSGLVLYIFVNTFMTVIQQYLNQHDMGFMDVIHRLRGKSVS